MSEIVLKVSMHCEGCALHDFWQRRFLLGFLVIFWFLWFFLFFFLFFFLYFFFPPLCFPLVFSLPIQNTKIKNQNPEWYIDGNWRKKNEKRMVMQTSPIGVDDYRDKVVVVDFCSFYLCKCVWVLFHILYMPQLVQNHQIWRSQSLILSSSNDVALKLTSLTALL